MVADDTKYIQRRYDRWRVILPPSKLPGRYLGTFESLGAAQDARDRYLAELAQSDEDGDAEPEIDGWTNEDGGLDPESLWQDAFKAQLRAERQARRRANQTITVPEPDRPFALAYLSDLHIGSAGTDYRAMRADAELIRDTPRLWCGYHGDGINNWVVSKLAHLQRDEVMPLDAEIALFADWLRMIGPSLLWVVAGNHDNWTRKLAGIDLLRGLLDGVRVLYDRFEVTFRLVWGAHELRYKVRHKWRYNSVFNVTHSIEVGWQRGSTDFDVGIGGHTHIGTVCRPFWRHGRERYAVLTGTYKVDDPYQREQGWPTPMFRGCGAHVFWKDGLTFCHCLEDARELLERLS